MKINYVARHATGVIICGCQGGDPDAGPPYRLPVCPEGCEWVVVAEPFTRVGHADTEEPWLVDGAVVWVETRTPAEIEDQARKAKAQDMNEACRRHIELGFLCAALGAPCLYPAKAQDQANLVASVTDSLLAGDEPDWSTPFWCANEAGEWDYRPHTAAQIRAVGREGKAAIVGALQRNEALQRQIAEASVEQLESIVWRQEGA